MSVHSSLTRETTFSGVDYDDEIKPLGRFGAPKCRCTSGVIAMCVSMGGLVLLGVGACAVLFFVHDELAMAPGIVFVVVGLLLLVGGGGYYAVALMCADKMKHIVRRRSGNGPADTDGDNGNGPWPEQVLQGADERSAAIPDVAEESDAPPTYDSIHRASSVFAERAHHPTYPPLQSSFHPSQFAQQQSTEDDMVLPHGHQPPILQPPKIRSSPLLPHFQPQSSDHSPRASQQTTV